MCGVKSTKLIVLNVTKKYRIVTKKSRSNAISLPKFPQQSNAWGMEGDIDMPKREDALRFLYKQLKDAKIALGRAEDRPNVKQEELDNLQRKIDVIDWLIPLAIKAEE